MTSINDRSLLFYKHKKSTLCALEDFYKVLYERPILNYFALRDLRLYVHKTLESFEKLEKSRAYR